MSSSLACHAAFGAVVLCVSIAGCSSEPSTPGTGGVGGTTGVGGVGAGGAGAGSGGTGLTAGVGGATAGVGGASAGAGGATGGAGSGGVGPAGAAGGGMGGGSGVAGVSGSGSGSGGMSMGGGSGAGAAGMSGTAGSGGNAQGGAAGTAGSAGSAGKGGTSEPFSFFVTSLEAVRRESGSMDGFGGDLGGLEGADEICTRIAESSMPGSGAKGWRAFLSTTTVNAITRIGTGPWYDRLGRVFAMDVEGLLMERPMADTLIINDLPNELGQPNRAGTGTGMDDNHDTITASNTMGEWDGGSTCDDWTSAEGSDGPRIGHSWPANSGRHWIEAHTAPGCVPSVNLIQSGAGSGDGIGNGGGYGGWYCFALMP
jgi:hypothetical protein